MAITIEEYQIRQNTHKLYDVNFFGDVIHTLVTYDPTMVSQWLSETQYLNNHRRHLIVGLDVEWRPSINRIQNPVATLQLCVDRRCLMYQLIYSSYIPHHLVEFLSNQDHTFVGVGIASDLEKLRKNYGFGYNVNAVDLSKLAVDTYHISESRNIGLKDLARFVLGKDFEKPRMVTMSWWDNPQLTHDQVQYACVDAFVSFEIGRVLNAAG